MLMKAVLVRTIFLTVVVEGNALQNERCEPTLQNVRKLNCPDQEKLSAYPFRKLHGGSAFSKTATGLNSFSTNKVEGSVNRVPSKSFLRIPKKPVKSASLITATKSAALIPVTATVKTLPKPNEHPVRIPDFKTEESKKLLEWTLNKQDQDVKNKEKYWDEDMDDVEYGEKVYPIKDGECMRFKRLHWIMEDDLISLKENKWLTNYIIDFTIVNIIGASDFHAKGKYAYLLATIGTTFIVNGENWTPQNVINRIKLKNKTVIIPINFNNTHWCLMVANTVQKTIQFYDPAGNSKENLGKAEKILKDFVKFLSKRNRFVGKNEKIVDDVEKWRAVPAKIRMPLQKDDHNCGVFIIMYIDCLIHNHKTVIDPKLYRDRIRETIYFQTI